MLDIDPQINPISKERKEGSSTSMPSLANNVQPGSNTVDSEIGVGFGDDRGGLYPDMGPSILDEALAVDSPDSSHSISEKHPSESGTPSPGNQPPVTMQPGEETSKEPERPTAVSRVISVPVGRTMALSEKIEGLRDQLDQTEENIQHLEHQAAFWGGELALGVGESNQLTSARSDVERFTSRITALEEEQRLQSRYEIELGIYAVIRQTMAIAQGNPLMGGSISNTQVIALTERLFPSFFNRESILLGLLPGNLARQFGSQELIDKEVKEIDTHIRVAEESDSQLLRERKNALAYARDVLQQGGMPLAPPWSEISDDIDTPLPRFPEKAGPQHSYEIGDGRFLRFCVLPQKTGAGQELGVGAIGLHEEYLPGTAEKLRLTISYCTAWTSGQFSLDENPDLKIEIQALSRRLCGLCTKYRGDVTSSYRLPPCTLFLRFYDQTELLEDRFKASRLLNIPMCKVLEAESRTKDHKLVLKASDLYTCSIPDWMFGELFSRGMIGSRWIRAQDLEQVYKVLKDDMPKDVGWVVHSQVYSRPAVPQGCGEPKV